LSTEQLAAFQEPVAEKEALLIIFIVFKKVAAFNDPTDRLAS